MTDFAEWRSLNYDAATVQLWVFKKSTSEAKFKAWHVRTDDAIEQLFRDTVKREVAATTEEIAYSPISQNNESSCLTHALAESVGLIALLNQVDVPEAENVDAELRHLKGAAGYLVKFQHGEQVVYAIRRTAPTWKPKVRNSLINAIFHNGELSATPEETFSFDSFFDFYCFNETIFVKAKRAYESTMSEKKVYQRSFEDLSVDPNFTSIFVDIQPLKDYVGSNAMQLRRITVIQQKALYQRAGFTGKVKTVNDARNFGLNFDAEGKIIVCPNTVKTIMQVLLDHRLLSEITDTIYDVPGAEVV
ncbi:Kiwa anti-phage protein KwaB-like domain-containing protein [Chromobacterium vaccinii]|uniref:Kiwa anti-phage protein KwaB-like domain-containing protein n=1 Tax=Chromobacterium vaccinii TaxID=1108595 RepID=UPI003260237E